MFTVIAFAAVALIVWNEPRRHRFDSEDPDVNLKQSRQDLRFISYLLVAVVIMLGVIADKLR
jgi:hypothetical protein